MSWQRGFNLIYISLACAFAGQAVFIAGRYVRHRRDFVQRWKHVSLAGLGGFLIGVGLSVNALLAMETVPAARPLTLLGLLCIDYAMLLLFSELGQRRLQTEVERTAAHLLLSNKEAADELLKTNARLAKELLELDRRLNKKR